MKVWGTTALVGAAVLVLTGAKDCGGGVGRGGVKEPLTTTAVLKCRGSGVTAEANGSGYPKSKKLLVNFTLRGPIDDTDDASGNTGRGSWTVHSKTWHSAPPGRYKVSVDVHVSGRYKDHASDDCEKK